MVHSFLQLIEMNPAVRAYARIQATVRLCVLELGRLAFEPTAFNNAHLLPVCHAVMQVGHPVVNVRWCSQGSPPH
jgi:hypothetical protein